ncbi:hypothetical protein LCGC14_2953000, partial [marine sediment metagenome]
MIDIKQIRENPQSFKEAAKTKKIDVNIDRLLEIDSALKDAKKQLQDLAAEKNRIGKSIPKLSGEEKESALVELSALKENETNLNDEVKK